MSPLNLPANLKFGPFSVLNQVFHLSPSRLSFASVNLKPLLPGHVLVCPVRPTLRLSQLTASETSDLFQTVQRVSRTLERVYSASSFNVAVQDGVEAGQTVPHVHVHIIPRRPADMAQRGGNDAIYDLMEQGNLGAAFDELQRRRDASGGVQNDFARGPDAEEKRMPRSADEMKVEAEWLRGEMEKDGE